MPTFIKTGFWEKTKKGYREWLNLDQFVESKIPTPTYKVFTALLTQSGVGDLIFLYFDDTPGGPDLTIGVTYQISNNTAGLDVTNIGAPNNTVGTFFVATGTRPTNWGEGTLTYSTGAPVATVLENTIGNIWFTYDDIGYYGVNSNNLFINNKTYQNISLNTINLTGRNTYIASLTKFSLNLLTIAGFSVDGNNLDGQLDITPIEIRVYN